MVIPANGAPSLDVVIHQMLDRLRMELPAPPPPPPPGSPLPPAGLRLLSVAQRPLGLANVRGNETVGSLGPIALKGGRLDAAVLFEVWGNSAANADAAALALHGALMGARDGLRADGFLRAEGADFSAAEEDTDLSAWRETASYRFLYEYQYRDVDESLSFITRIPVHSDPETAGSPDREVEIVTGRMVRWQRPEEAQGMPPPPTLVVQGRTTVRGLTAAAFLPDTPAAGVELLRTFEGATGAPAVAATLQDLATAPHIRKTYASLAGFLGDLTATGDSVVLGDLEGHSGSYALRTFTFGPALELARPIDRLEISTSADAWEVSNAVLYLRAEGA